MSLARIQPQFARHVADLERKGMAKGTEKVITGVLAST